MGTEELEIQVQKMSEQLDLQAEAITRLVELVSNLDGVDAGTVKSYARRLQRVHGHTTAASRLEDQSVDQPTTEAAPTSIDESGVEGKHQ